MTFEEWLGDLKTFWDTREFARKAWDAGQAAEREACVVVADDERTPDADELNEKHEQDPRSVDRYWLGWNDAAQTIAAAIRARSDVENVTREG